VIISRRMRCVGHVAHIGELRNSYKVLVRKSEGKRPLRRPGCRWETYPVFNQAPCHEDVWRIEGIA